ncbi:MAG TPA: FAD-dependent oxidoreductase, partial [Myxococcota bacterium]|nr:FAD-dependent oxidoreductase [Myxococcota bacterium]
KEPRFVIAENCTGCLQCEVVCPEVRSDAYNEDLADRKVAYIPFNLANPRIASIERKGVSAPCIAGCPGGVKPYGYVSLVRAGQFEDAMDLHLEDVPLPGCLGRACYAPCQAECTRASLEGPVDMRRIKRFFADDYYAKHLEPKPREKAAPTGRRVAIVGSGPAGLTAAYALALRGHEVVIFEAAPLPGGMMRLTLPEFRLPNHVVDRDVKNVTALGVEIRCNTRVTDLNSLKEQGFDAVFMATGTHDSTRLRAPGADLDGIVNCLDILRESKIGQKRDLTGKKVMVVGGGNTAMDSARTAIRLGSDKVTVVYRRSLHEMPAFEMERHEALEEGVEFAVLCNPVAFSGENGRVTSATLIRMELGEPGPDGRRQPVEVKGSEYKLPVDLVIEAIGLSPGTGAFKDQLELRRDRTIAADERTLQTGVPWVFAGGDAVTGPTSIIEAVGQGRRAAFYMDKWLAGQDLTAFEYGDTLPAVDKQTLLSRHDIPSAETLAEKFRDGRSRIVDFDDIESTFTASEAVRSASRCMDCSNCRECHQCVVACPAYAIDFSQKKQVMNVKADAVVLSTGYDLWDPAEKPHYHSRQLPNVITSMQMERLIAPTRPFNAVLRPGDGKVPDNIAYVLCAGSRDVSLDNYRTCPGASRNSQICSQICCMYSAKQAQLLMGALPLADITVYYMDIRAFGKNYEEFFQQSKGMGISFVKGRVAKITDDGKGRGDVILRVEDVENGVVKEVKHDLVVLAVGLRPQNLIVEKFLGQVPELDPYSYILQADPMVNPAVTTVDGVFVAGTAAAPMDIPDSILSAGAAAAQVAEYLNRKTVTD